MFKARYQPWFLSFFLSFVFQKMFSWLISEIHLWTKSFKIQDMISVFKIYQASDNADKKEKGVCEEGFSMWPCGNSKCHVSELNSYCHYLEVPCKVPLDLYSQLLQMLTCCRTGKNCPDELFSKNSYSNIGESWTALEKQNGTFPPSILIFWTR